MQYILEIIDTFVQNQQMSQFIFVAITAAAAFAFILSVGYLVVAVTDPARKRLSALLSGEEVVEPVNNNRKDFIQSVMGPAAGALLSSSSKDIGHIKKKLIIAGFRSSNAATNFYAIKTILAVTLPAVVLLVTQLFAGLATANVIFFCLVAMFVGLITPNYVLTKLVARRQRKLRLGFPDALDLLVVCVESGLGLTNALARVAQEMEVSHPELASDLALINKEIMVGIPREKALRNLAERTGLDEIKGLSALLDQSMRFGTSVADALRVYAEEFRDKRTQLAEEAAAKISTKLIFPLTLFIWPSFFVVAIGPAVLRLMHAFNG